MHIENKNKNTKRRIETKNIHFFIFELKNRRMLILWTRLVLWIKIAATLASHVLVVIFVAAYLTGTYGLFMVGEKVEKCCFWFGTYQRQFVICDPISLNSIPEMVTKSATFCGCHFEQA